MHRCIILITTSFSSIVQQFIDASNFSCHLLLEVVSFGVLEHVFWVKITLIYKARRIEAYTYHKCLCRSEP